MQRHFRLRDRRDFDRLRQQGRVYTGSGLRLGVLPNGLDHNRYGFVTSKNLGKAVVRNRARRLLREAVRQLHPHLKPGWDVVLVARKPLVGKPFSAVQRIVKELCYQAQLVEKVEGAEG